MSHYIEFDTKDKDDDIAKPPHPLMMGSQTSAVVAIATDSQSATYSLDFVRPPMTVPQYGNSESLKEKGILPVVLEYTLALRDWSNHQGPLVGWMDGSFLF